MNLTPVKTPLVVKKIFPNYTWEISSSTKEIYLTFDDGPTPEITNWVLNLLKQYDAKATFFCIGNNIEKHPDIFQNIINEGHAIGNHTQNHIKGWKTSVTDYLENVQQTHSLVINNNQIKLKLFRPPYGQITPKQGSEIIKLGYKIIMWTVLSADFDTSISKEKCFENVLKNTKNGSIIVFHDSLKASEKLRFVLPKILEDFENDQYASKSF